MGGGVEVSHIGPGRKQMWIFLPIFSIEVWLFDAQDTFYLFVKGLKKYIFHDLFVVAIDHLEGPASCKR